MESNKGIESVTEIFKRKMKEKIDNENDERKKEVLKEALQRGMGLLGRG